MEVVPNTVCSSCQNKLGREYTNESVHLDAPAQQGVSLNLFNKAGGGAFSECVSKSKGVKLRIFLKATTIRLTPVPHPLI